MPKIFRSMRRDGQFPEVSPTAKGLGVRPGPPPNGDIAVTPAGSVLPGTGGLSVAPEWQLLPQHRIPKRLRSKFPRAQGSNDVHLWRMGAGPFLTSSVTASLVLKPDGQRHGTVQPVVECMLQAFQLSLAATRESWVEVELEIVGSP
jgi:hypothetical protein